MQTVSIKNFDNKHSEWSKSLGFYKDELNIFKERLNEVAKKNTARETMEMVEHFFNQFMIQAENIDLLNHDINQYTDRIAKAVRQYAGHVDEAEMAAHAGLQERFVRQTIIFKELKDEFMKFLSKVM